MIKSIKIDNFKSLNNFEIHLKQFSILMGDNSAGKTSVLQAIGFLICCCTSSFDKFLDERKLLVSDIESQLNNKRNITLTTTMQFDEKEIVWQIVVAGFKDRLVLKKESVMNSYEGIRLLSCTGSTNSFILNKKTNKKDPIMQGEINNSIIKFIDSDKQADNYPELAAIKRFFLNMESLDLLSPYSMKEGSKGLSDTIELSGENLAAFIKKLPQAQREALVADVKKFIPKVDALTPKSKQYGMTYLESEEKIGNKTIRMSSVNMSDGFLRIIAICSTRFLNNNGGAILFDELEDGINNEHLEQLVSLLKEIQRGRDVQIIATTHNPLLLDYVLDDSSNPPNNVVESLMEAVIFMYSDESGQIVTKNILDSSVIQEQLNYMFPGEIVLNTSNCEMKSILERGG